METKQYLKQAYRLNELIESNKQEIADLRTLSYSLPGTDYSQDRVQHSSSSDAGYTRIVHKIIELEKIINDDTEKMLCLKLEIRTVINNVADNDEKLLLKYRYLNFMSWDDICDKMCVSMRTAHRIHSEALANVVVPE
jgi:hypothetical protein